VAMKTDDTRSSCVLGVGYLYLEAAALARGVAALADCLYDGAPCCGHNPSGTLC
jgi:hypothetical protein